MRRRAIALALAGTAACSYIVELPTSDVSIPLPDASPDGATDVAAPESDASPFDADIPFCESRTTPSLFCADFDDNPPPDLATLGTVQGTRGSMEIANAISFSPARSLLSTVNGADASSMLVHPLGASLEAVTVSSSLLVSTWGSTSARFNRIELATGDAGVGSLCVVQLTATTTWLVSQACSSNGVPFETLTTDSHSPIETRKWQRFSLSVKLTPPKTVTLDIDGVPVVNVAALNAMRPAPTSVAFGVEHSASGTVLIFQDDLLVTSP
jgi:hypothetical protein